MPFDVSFRKPIDLVFPRNRTPFTHDHSRVVLCLEKSRDEDRLVLAELGCYPLQSDDASKPVRRSFPACKADPQPGEGASCVVDSVQFSAKSFVGSRVPHSIALNIDGETFFRLGHLSLRKPR